MRRFAVFTFLVVAAALAVRWATPSLEEWARARVQADLSAALKAPVSIGALDVSLVPPRGEVRRVAVGEPAAASIGRLSAALRLRQSVTAWRPVVDVDIAEVSVDVERLQAIIAELGDEGDAWGAGAGADIHEASVSDLQVRVPFMDDVLEVTVPRSTVRLAGRLRRTRYELGIPGLDVRRGERALRLDRIAVRGVLDDAGFELDGLQIDGAGVHGSLAGAGTDEGRAAELQVDLRQFGVLADDLDFAAGEAAFTGRVNGPLEEARLHGTLEVSEAAIFDRPLGHLKAGVEWAARDLRFTDVRLAGEAGYVDGSVDILFEGKTALQADLSWHDVDVEGLLRQIGVQAGFENRFDAETRVSGSLDPLDLAVGGDIHVRPSGVGESPAPGRIEASARIGLDGGSMNAELLQGDDNRAGASLTWGDAGLLGEFEVRAADVEALSRLAPTYVTALELSGAMRSTLLLSERENETRLRGVAEARGLGVGGVLLSRLRFRYGIEENVLNVQEGEFETDGGRGRIQGKFALQEEASNDWEVGLDGVETALAVRILQRFAGVDLPVAGGHLTGRGQCQGPWSEARVRADLTARDARVAGETFDRIRAKIHADTPGWATELDAVHREGEEIAVVIDARDPGAARVSVTSTPVSLAGLTVLEGSGVEGTLRVAADLQGALAIPGGSLQVSLSDVSWQGQEFGDASLRASGEKGTWRFWGETVDGRVRADGRVDLDGERRYEVEARLRDPTLVTAGLDGPLQLSAAGSLHLVGSLDELARPSGSAHFDRLELVRGEQRATATGPVRVEVDRGNVRVLPFALDVPEGRLGIALQLQPPADLVAELEGEIGLGLLEWLVSEVSAARGKVQLRGRFTHSADEGWNLDGRATVRDAVVDVGLPMAFTGGSAELSFRDTRVRVTELRGTVGTGRVEVQGSIDVGEGPRLAWTLDEIDVTPVDGLEARMSGSGEINGEWHRLEVEGYVEVLEALYDRDVELRDVLPAIVRRFRPAARDTPPATTVVLDLRLRAADRIYVDNNVARVEMRADLRLRGDAQRPSIVGNLRLLEGELTLRGNKFEVLSGTIDFRDPFRLNPALDVTAEANIDDGEDVYAVTMHVTGTGEDPRVEFSADDPSLTQNDVVSLVAFGKTMSALQRGAGGVTAADAIALIPTGPVEEEIGQWIGVDRFEVKASQASDSNAVEPMVTIGKSLSERLTAFVTTSFGVEQRRIVELEYRWSRRVSLLGSWESETESQAGAFGGDVKFRYEFRRLPFTLFDGDEVLAPQDDAE